MSGTAELQTWLCEQWRARFAQSIEAMTGEPVSTEVQENSSRHDEVSIGTLYRLSLGDNGLLWVGAPANSWHEVGKRALIAAGLDDAGEDDIRNTYLEILGQAGAGVAQAISSRLGREVLPSPGEESPSAPDGAWVARFTVRFPASQAVEFFLGASVELLNGLVPEPAPEPELLPIPSAPSSSQGASKTLDLLLEVELPVSVSFGRTQIPFKDVIKLSTGSILELNRAVSEPVEIIVNNCVIARGDVVVIDGNYGVRLTQVISRQERLRTLH